MISRAEIARQAHLLGVGDRVVEKDYVLSWVLLAIAASSLRAALVFKGGTALKRCYYPGYRFSEDLDFTLRDGVSHVELVSGFEALFPWLRREVNLALSMHSVEQRAEASTTLLINYIGPLRARMGARRLKIDITRDELLLHQPTERRLLLPYSDCPSDATLFVYTLEEILTEKLCALIGRTEPRDLYDVYWLLESGDVDLSFLPFDLAAKCRHKGYETIHLGETLTRRAETFSKLWGSRLAVQVTELPHLDMIIRSVRRRLRALELA